MIGPIVVLHLICAVGFSIFMLQYYNILYDKPACNHMGGCEMQDIYKVTKNSTEDENGTLTTTTIKPVKTPACPVKECRGDEFCCKLCSEVKGNDYSERPIHMESTLYIHNPAIITIAIVGVVIGVFIIVCIANICRMKSGKRGTTFVRFLIGITLFLLFLTLAGSVAFIVISIISDFDYYKDCHAKLTLNISWGFVCGILAISYSTSILPSFTRIMRAEQLKRDALDIPDHDESTQMLIKADRLKHEPIEKPGLFSTIARYLLTLCLLWWPAITIYFIGVGQGRWLPIV